MSFFNRLHHDKSLFANFALNKTNANHSRQRRKDVVKFNLYVEVVSVGNVDSFLASSEIKKKSDSERDTRKTHDELVHLYKLVKKFFVSVSEKFLGRGKVSHSPG